MGTFLFQTSRTMPALFLWVTAVASVMFCCGPSARTSVSSMSSTSGDDHSGDSFVLDIRANAGLLPDGGFPWKNLKVYKQAVEPLDFE